MDPVSLSQREREREREMQKGTKDRRKEAPRCYMLPSGEGGKRKGIERPRVPFAPDE